MLLDNGWRWSVRFAAGIITSLALAAPAYASFDGYDPATDAGSLYVNAQQVMGAGQRPRFAALCGGVGISSSCSGACN